MKPATFGGAVNLRRIVALDARERDLKKYQQELKEEAVPKNGKPNEAHYALIGIIKDYHIPRIQREIATLRSRITTDAVALSYKPKKHR